jgi:hypothetical protein
VVVRDMFATLCLRPLFLLLLSKWVVPLGLSVLWIDAACAYRAKAWPAELQALVQGGSCDTPAGLCVLLVSGMPCIHTPSTPVDGVRCVLLLVICAHLCTASHF